MGGWGTSLASLVIFKSAKNTQSISITLAAKEQDICQPSHYFDLSINGSEKMYCKEDFRVVDWNKIKV